MKTNIRVSGRQGRRASAFVLSGVLVTAETAVIRTDDDRDDGFWHEATLTRADLLAMLAEMDTQKADDFDADPATFTEGMRTATRLPSPDERDYYDPADMLS